MQKPIDSLKLSSQEWTKLQRELQKQVRLPPENVRVGGVRVGMGTGVIALLQIMSNGLQCPHFHIRCRNISRSGLGFMHGQFINPGTPVEVTLVNQNRKGVIVTGSIVRARLIDNHIHELGVKFDELLDLDEIIDMGLAQAPSEQELEAHRELDEANAAKEDETAAAEASNGIPDQGNGEAKPNQTTAPVATDNPQAIEPDKAGEPAAEAA